MRKLKVKYGKLTPITIYRLLTKRREMTTDILNETTYPTQHPTWSPPRRELSVFENFIVIVNCNQRLDSIRVNGYGIWIVCECDPLILSPVKLSVFSLCLSRLWLLQRR